jgi:hypothetical protein
MISTLLLVAIAVLHVHGLRDYNWHAHTLRIPRPATYDPRPHPRHVLDPLNSALGLPSRPIVDFGPLYLEVPHLLRISHNPTYDISYMYQLTICGVELMSIENGGMYVQLYNHTSTRLFNALVGKDVVIVKTNTSTDVHNPNSNSRFVEETRSTCK